MGSIRPVDPSDLVCLAGYPSGPSAALDGQNIDWPPQYNGLIICLSHRLYLQSANRPTTPTSLNIQIGRLSSAKLFKGAQVCFASLAKVTLYRPGSVTLYRPAYVAILF